MIMERFFLGIFMVAWMCTVSGCLYNEPPLYLKNNFNQDLRFAKPVRDYPDTILPPILRGVTIKTSSTVFIVDGKNWKYIYNVRFSSGIMSVFILSCDTLAKYTWEQVREDYNILVRYDLRLQDLYKLDFVIVYPPNETMKDIKMYPPYSHFQTIMSPEFRTAS